MGLLNRHGNNTVHIRFRSLYKVNNYIVKSYRVVIVGINIVTMRTNKT